MLGCLRFLPAGHVFDVTLHLLLDTIQPVGHLGPKPCVTNAENNNGLVSLAPSNQILDRVHMTTPQPSFQGRPPSAPTKVQSQLLFVSSLNRCLPVYLTPACLRDFAKHTSEHPLRFLMPQSTRESRSFQRPPVPAGL